MKRATPELKKQILADIKENFLKGVTTSQKDLALKYDVYETTIRKQIEIAMKEVSEKRRIEKEQAYKIANSEEEVVKYGIPERYKLTK